MERHLFYDENDEAIEFILDAKFSLDDRDYVAMIPAEEDDSYIYILRVDSDEDGNEFLVGIEDEELKDATEAYEELMEEKL